MTAPDFKTQITEIVSYGETTGFILKDITGAYDASTNTGGWDPDAGSGPNLAPEDIKYAMVMVTPYKGSDIPILLEITDTFDDLYWEKILDHLGGAGVTLNATVLNLTSFINGYWKFKSYYWPGYYNAAFTYDAVTNPGTGFSLGEIVQGQTSGATGFIVHETGTTEKHISWIQGTFSDGETIKGLTSGATVLVDTFVLVGELLTDEVYSYQNNQSILTATRNIIRKLPLDLQLPDINTKHVNYVRDADLFLETLDDAVEVGQIDNYTRIFDYLIDLIDKIDKTYCV